LKSTWTVAVAEPPVVEVGQVRVEVVMVLTVWSARRGKMARSLKAVIR
jgi:hypothetical protein